MSESIVCPFRPPRDIRPPDFMIPVGDIVVFGLCLCVEVGGDASDASFSKLNISGLVRSSLISMKRKPIKVMNDTGLNIDYQIRNSLVPASWYRTRILLYHINCKLEYVISELLT